MDALDVRELGERFDVALCFGILHRMTDPIALLQALADVLTPEMYAEIDKEIAERGTHTPTEVATLDATVLDVTTEDDCHWASVHFTGMLREDGMVLPKPFDEVWNLVKPVDGKTGWLLAGIRQPA